LSGLSIAWLALVRAVGARLGFNTHVGVVEASMG